MTIANTFASKLVVGFVAVAMFASLSFAPIANAQSVEDLQAQITALLAQITSLQGQLGAGGSAVAAGCEFSRALTVGSTGADVSCLQHYLISAGHGVAAGATGYFGAQTQAAVAAWQAANGVAPAAGYFGPVSQAKYAALMAAMPPASDDDANDDANDDDDSSTDLSGEASMADDGDLSDGDDTNIEEGQQDAPVAEYQVEFENGDARITRLDITLVDTGTEEDPWDTFETVSLWVDGDMVAEIAADDEDEYLDEDDGSLRFSGLDIVAMEDEQVDIIIAVTVQSSVDSMPATWNVDVTGLRFEDGDDVTSTETITVDSTDFTIEAEGSDDEVIVKASAEDPDSTTLQVETDEKSDWMTIFAFDLDTDDSVNDIEVNELVVNLFSPSAETISDMVSDAQLVIDGETFDDFTWANAGTVSASTTFDIDGDLVIEAGDRVTVEFQVEFKSLTDYQEGDTIAASTTGESGDFEGADDVTGEGSATGETHTLRSEGAIIELNTMTETLKENAADDTTDDEGQFVIKFDITAFETDLWVNKTAASGTGSGANGVNFLVENASGSQITTGTSSGSLSSTADTDGTRFKVNEGETETFTMTVVYDPATAGFYQVQLYSFNFNDSNAGPDVWQLALPASDYETDQLDI